MAVATSDVEQTVFIDSLTVLIVSIDEKSRDNTQTHSGLCRTKHKCNEEKKKMGHVTSLNKCEFHSKTLLAITFANKLSSYITFLWQKWSHSS